MLNKLLSMIRGYDMIHPKDRVICAVSGGADSVALLFGLYLLKEKLDITLEAAHYNHRLRGAESDRDEAFVAELCDRLSVPLHIGSGNVSAGKKGLEAAARDARYAFFATLQGKIATAHTADDNAETVLMHMVRGTGLRGLGGISPVRDQLIRPMLLVTRRQVLAFLKEYNLSYVCDSSNDTDAFLRNRLRHRVMPLLQQENPRLSQNLSAMALRLREDEQALTPQADYAKGLDIEELRQLPRAVRSRVLEGFLRHCGIKEPEAAHIGQLESLIASKNPSAQAGFPGGIAICRRYDRLEKATPKTGVIQCRLPCPGVVQLSDLGLRISCEPAPDIQNTTDTVTVAPEGTVLVRCRQPGDTIRLSGGTKSLKKLFIDRKIPADMREEIPVIADERGVLAVCGIGVNLDRAARQLPAMQIRFETVNSINRNSNVIVAGGNEHDERH